ncbi:MAG: hypothetical protein H0X30_03675 [Anaerolineae bacterium]|nr:hypothetical protein [Anaerolineae bacterium]
MNEIKKPTMQELTSLSDEELTKQVDLALQQVAENAKQNKSTFEILQLYLIYQAERHRRGIV